MNKFLEYINRILIIIANSLEIASYIILSIAVIYVFYFLVKE